MEKDQDRYASILEVCKAITPSCEALALTKNQTQPVSTNIPPTVRFDYHFVDHSLDFDGSILTPESMADYLCPTPLTSHHEDASVNNNDYDIEGQGQPEDDGDIEDQGQREHDDQFEGQGQPEDDDDNKDYLCIEGRYSPTPPCVVSYQVLSPPSTDFWPSSPHQVDFASIIEISSDSSEEAQHDDVWLSQLKSMARQEGVFDHAIAIVTEFRASEYVSPPPSDSLMRSLARHVKQRVKCTLERIPNRSSDT